MSSAAPVFDQALALSEEDRVKLVESLLDSLEPSDPDHEAKWRKEVARRIAEVDSGAVKLVPWPEARKQIFG